MPGIVETPLPVEEGVKALKLSGGDDTQKFASLTSQLKTKGAARLQALDDVRLATANVSPATESRLIALLPAVLAAAGDKVVAEKAELTALTIVQRADPNAVKAILPLVLASLRSTHQWTVKMASLHCIEALCESAPVQLSFHINALMPLISEAMWDTKKDVARGAYRTMEKICELIVNKDLEKFKPALIQCISKPERVPETVHLLGATTFVSDVDKSTMALMTPLLERGLAERDTAIKRKSAVIVDNLCKLVDQPQIVAPFLPKLIPALEKNYDNLADPEARSKTKQGLDTLKRVGNVGEDGSFPKVSQASDPAAVALILKSCVATDKQDDLMIDYIGAIAAQLVDQREAEPSTWTAACMPYATVLVGDDAQELINVFRKRASPAFADDEEIESDDDEGEDLCYCTFSLAYGAKILLNQTSLRLKRGARYGLLGPNGCGKSSLLRAINNEQVEGFPKQSEVKTVFVEHELDGAQTTQSVLEWTSQKLAGAGINKSEAELKEVLVQEFGFTADQILNAVTTLSGGQKMRLNLCAAMQQKPDILLLDEPTNHLDVKNVKWLEDYLTSQSLCTSLIVSHDSGFLNNVLQHVIHYERFKLKQYRGNMDQFIAKVPAAKVYKEGTFGDTDMEFKFPEPGFLEGVKTKGRAIVKVNNMELQYPGASKPQLTNVSFQVSLGSRIFVIGPNGTGKSTLVNVMTGELLPTKGDVYQHPNLRIGYIKQHAFAHIDDHLNKTPSEYIQWRFATGEDRETMDRANKQITDDDLKSAEKIFKIDGQSRRVIGVHGRRKNKNSYEYECSFTLGENIGQKNERWTPMMTADNAWIPRSDLIDSHQKLVAEVDQKEALASGQFRPLVRREIEEHCANFSLDAELTSHSRMSGLSGGQRVKVVLAAALWLKPHICVLDEPTNYLDRDSLGALSKALKVFEGGVVVITHNQEFSKALGENVELWAIQDGVMSASGHDWRQNSGDKVEEKENDADQFDAMGNKIEGNKKAKKQTSSEARKARKDRMMKKKKGIDVDDDDF